MSKNEFSFIFMHKAKREISRKATPCGPPPSICGKQAHQIENCIRYYKIKVKTTMLTCTSRAWGNPEEWTPNQAHSNHKTASTTLCLRHPIYI